MMPIGALLSPNVPVSKVDTSGLGDMGEVFLKLGEEQKNRALREKLAADQNALEKTKIEGTNRYYDMQADTHRMLAEDRKDARREKEQGILDKRMDFLRDAYRRAKTPGEKASVLDQIRSHAASMGMSFEELPSEASAPAPDVAATGSAEGKPGFTPFGPPGFKTPKPNKKFAGQLGAYMASPESGASSQGPDVASAEQTVSPFPWDAVGLPGPAPEAKPKAPAGTGRFVLKDKAGNVQQIWDEGANTSENRKAIIAMMQTRPGDSPEEKAAAERAIQRGTEALSLVGPEKAAQLADADYQREMAGYKKQPTQAQKGSGGPGGPTKAEFKVATIEGEERNRIIARVGRDYNAKAADETESFANMAMQKMRLATGTGDYAAFADWLKSESGKVVTDREREAFLSAAGGFTGLQNRIGRWTNNGRFDPKYMSEVQGLMEAIKNEIRAKRDRAASLARGEAERSGLSPESVDVVGGHFTGEFTGGTKAPLGARKPAEGAKPGGSGRARADKWLSEQGVK
jgi:hypothetical protein